MTAKRAILDQKVQERLLESSTPDERPAMWLMMKIGMHPTNLARLSSSNLQKDEQGWWLQYSRVKNNVPCRELLPPDIGIELETFLKHKNRPKTRRGYFAMVHRVGKRIGLSDCSPMTLRYTAAVELLRRFREHPDRIDLVARKMGCRRDVIAQNYLDFADWESRNE